MDHRDQELLNKQLWGVSSSPPRNGGALGLAFAAVFLGGLSVGGIVFAHKSNQMQMTPRDATITLYALSGSPTPGH